MKSVQLHFVIMMTLMAFEAAISSTAQTTQRYFKLAAGLPQNTQTQPVMIEVVGPADSVMRFTYSLPEVKIKATGLLYNGTVLAEVEIGNSLQNGNEGEPVLPVIPAQFIIPAGYSLADIKIISASNGCSRKLATRIRF